MGKVCGHAVKKDDVEARGVVMKMNVKGDKEEEEEKN